MEPTPELLAQLDREDLDQARRMTPEERLRAGAELFDYACRITISGIRADNPGADESAVLRILRERIALADQVEADL
jgi:hypothetical protein